jgi:hypothetical protein
MFSFTAVIPLLGKETIVGEKSNWGLQKCAGNSRDVNRFTGHERPMESKTLTSDKSPV